VPGAFQMRGGAAARLVDLARHVPPEGLAASGGASEPQHRMRGGGGGGLTRNPLVWSILGVALLHQGLAASGSAFKSSGGERFELESVN
jgi:hypothetical protein